MYKAEWRAGAPFGFTREWRGYISCLITPGRAASCVASCMLSGFAPLNASCRRDTPKGCPITTGADTRGYWLGNATGAAAEMQALYRDGHPCFLAFKVDRNADRLHEFYPTYGFNKDGSIAPGFPALGLDDWVGDIMFDMPRHTLGEAASAPPPTGPASDGEVPTQVSADGRDGEAAPVVATAGSVAVAAHASEPPVPNAELNARAPEPREPGELPKPSNTLVPLVDYSSSSEELDTSDMNVDEYALFYYSLPDTWKPGRIDPGGE